MYMTDCGQVDMCSAAVLRRAIGSSPEVEWPSGAVFRGHAVADSVSAQSAEIFSDYSAAKKLLS